LGENVYEINLDEVETSQGSDAHRWRSAALVIDDSESGSAAPPLPLRAARSHRSICARRELSIISATPAALTRVVFSQLKTIQPAGALRDARLLTIVDHPRLTFSDHLARLRGRFLRTLDELFASRPEEGALARAMVAVVTAAFVERRPAWWITRKRASYHVMVLAGLHVGALAAFFLWIARKLRLSLFPRVCLTLLALTAYAGIVEDRPPILSRRPDGRCVFYPRNLFTAAWIC